MDPIALGGGEVCLDLARELVLPGDQERSIRLRVATGARIREAEVVHGAALARIERAARLERADRLLVLVDLQVHETEVQPVRGIGRRALDELLVDRPGVVEQLAAEVGQAKECEDARVLRILGERLAERDLCEVEPTLLELLAPGRDGLLHGLAVARRCHHMFIEPQTSGICRAMLGNLSPRPSPWASPRSTCRRRRSVAARRSSGALACR